jgi:hypothetical protein
MNSESISKRASIVLSSLNVLLWLSGLAYAGSTPGFSSFDFPGAIDTQATAITPSGNIVGRYTSSDGKQHGFLLASGKFRSIDFPGATATDVTWINPRGQIVGATLHRMASSMDSFSAAANFRPSIIRTRKPRLYSASARTEIRLDSRLTPEVTFTVFFSVAGTLAQLMFRVRPSLSRP